MKRWTFHHFRPSTLPETYILFLSLQLLFVVGDTHVFKVVGWMHLFSCKIFMKIYLYNCEFSVMCQVTGVVVFPFAWHSSKMTDICGSESYDVSVQLITHDANKRLR